MKSLLLSALVLLCGCAVAPAATQTPEAPATAGTGAAVSHPPAKKRPGAAPKTAHACAAAGGTWRAVGMLRQELCDLPTHDAGKPCTGSSECESVCVAPAGADLTKPVTGACYRSFVLVGTCLARVENGRVESAQCAD
jgi:hypothetical protein